MLAVAFRASKAAGKLCDDPFGALTSGAWSVARPSLHFCNLVERDFRGAKVNPYHPQRASSHLATQIASSRVTHEGSVLSSRDGTVPLTLIALVGVKSSVSVSTPMNFRKHHRE